jgi:O-methyltransferase involved in polyketide biosynthesis
MLWHRRSDAISPTAYYTGHVWARHGLSHPQLETLEGRVFYEALRPAAAVSGVLGGPTLEGFLLARHRVIDDILERAIAAGEISQVIEVAAGMSPRGLRFAGRHGEAITYVEADLPGMAARKRRALERAGALSAHHRVVDLDALRDDGPGSLAAVAATLDPGRGTAIVTEGLLNYFDRSAVLGMWERFARTLGGFPAGLYVADVHLRSEHSGPLAWGFTAALSAFVLGRVFMHFTGPDEAEEMLRSAGFAHATVRKAVSYEAAAALRDDAGGQLVRIVEARTA